MKNRKMLVYLMTVVLVLVMVVAELYLMKQEDFPFAVEVTTKGGSETLIPWYQEEENCYYIFLPSYADPDQAKLVTNFLSHLWIQDIKVKTGTACGTFSFNEKLEIRYGTLRENQVGTIYFCKSGNVPTLYIDTASGTMDYIHEQKGNTESAKLRLYMPDGKLGINTRIQSISGRGNTTWKRSPKKPYSLELTQRADLLGMGSAKKWILLANYSDYSNMGNKMCFDFAAAAGCAYTPECQWVDLYLNGSYAGLYVLSERNEVDPQRIDIPKENSFLISTTLQRRSENRNYSSFTSDREIFMRIQHTEIPEQRMWEIWDRVENAIFAPDGIDPFSGIHWQDLIDMDSWAQQFLLWEVFADYDACTLSKFFYYDDDYGKVFAGPVWDMDNILNIQWWYTPNILASQREYIWNREDVNLFYPLYQKEPFRQRVKELYRQVYRPLLEELTKNGIQTYLTQSLPAGKMNHARWGGWAPEDMVQRLSQYLEERIAFLDDYWEAEEEYCIIELKENSKSQWRSFAVRRGESADFLPEDHQWVEYETGKPFDRMAPITQNWIIQQVENEE